MKITLYRMLLRQFVPVLLIATSFFVTILVLVDLFQNIARYIDLETPVNEMLRVHLLYLPKALHFALPMSLLFAVSFTLGTLYSNNELIAVFGSGVSLRSFVLPLTVVGLLMSAGSFALEEYLAIETLREKNQLEQELLNISRSLSNSNVTRLGSGSRVVYHADYFNDAGSTLNGVIIVEREEAEQEDTGPSRIISARSAVWNGSSWDMREARVFTWEDGDLVEESRSNFEAPHLTLPPTAFKRRGRDIDEMRLAEAQEWIESQREAGLPYLEDLTKYHERFSFALTPFVVVFISSAIGGRFRKNILLMSLLVSLSVSVVYYVTQMISGLLAYSAYLSPIMGAWSGVLLFSLLGLVMLRFSRT